MNSYLRFCVLVLFGFISSSHAAVRPIADIKFNATADAVSFHQATSKENLAYRTFLFRSQQQRILIQEKYKVLYNEELFPKPSGIWYDFFGDEYADLLHTMCRPITRQFALDMVEDSKPNFDSPNALIDAMALLSNELWRLVRAYVKEHEGGQPLFVDYLKNDLEHFEKMVHTISNGQRNESQAIDVLAARKDADFLFRIFGTTRSISNADIYLEHSVRDIFSLRSFGHIRQICKQYKASFDRELFNDIENYHFTDEFVKKAILAIIQVRIDAPTYFAERLYNSLNGPGTSERDLNRIIITRSTIDMEEIKNTFKLKYGKRLAAMIADDTSGKYQKMLLALIA